MKHEKNERAIFTATYIKKYIYTAIFEIILLLDFQTNSTYLSQDIPPQLKQRRVSPLRRSQWLARPTAVCEDPGSNLTADGCVYRDSHCNMQPWAWDAHLLQCIGKLSLASFRGR